MKAIKAIKKMVALGMGLTMVGATIMGASASLADLPAPFVQNGQADVNIVVGANAATEDVIGAADVAAMLASELAEQTARTSMGGGAEGTDNKIPVQSGSTEVSNFLSISDAGEDRLDDSDSALLKDRIYRDDDSGTTVEFEYLIHIGNATTAFSQDVEQRHLDAIEAAGGTVRGGSLASSHGINLDVPQLYLDLGEGSGITTATDTDDNLLVLEIKTIGSDELDVLNADDAEALPLPLASQQFRLQDIGSADDRIVLQTGVEFTARTGQDQVITLLGTEHTLEVGQGGESGDEFVMIIDGESGIVEEGEREYFSGQGLVAAGDDGVSIYCWDVLVVNQAEDVIANCLFAPTGEGELRLEKADDLTKSFTSVEDGNGNNIDGLEVAIVSGGSAENITSISFGLNPEDLDVDLLPWGSSVKMPGFAIWFEYAEPTPRLDDGSGDLAASYNFGMDRSEILFDVKGDKVAVEFTNSDNKHCELDVLDVASATTFSLDDDFVHGVTNLTDGDIFILHQDLTDEAPLSTVYEITDVDVAEQTADVRELCADELVATGENTQVSVGSNMPSADGVTITAIADYGSGAQVVLSEATKSAFYELHNLVTMTSIPAVGATGSSMYFSLTPDPNNKVYDNVQGSDSAYEFEVTVVSSDFNLGAIAAQSGVNANFVVTDGEEGDSDMDHTQTQYGDRILRDTDDNDRILVLTSWGDMKNYFYVNLGELGAAAASSSSATVKHLTVGSAKLDREVGALGGGVGVHLIVVGGPCANTVAAELMGNPANCVEGFETGKALIELFDLDDGKQAMLIAGFQARETRAAVAAVVAGLLSDLEGQRSATVTVSSTGSTSVQSGSMMADAMEADSTDEA